MTDINQNKNILDVLYGSAKTSLDMQRMHKKVLGILTSRAYIETLEFEQAMMLIQTIAGVEGTSNKFMIDFFKANNKSPEAMAKILEKLLDAANDDATAPAIAQHANTSLITSNRVRAIKAAALKELDARRGIKRGLDDEDDDE